MKTIDIWSDVACPWCFVGKRRLQRALADFSGQVELRWRAYLLHPDVPPDSRVTPREYLTHRFGDPERVEQAWNLLRELGAQDDIAFDFDAQPRIADMRPWHRLVKLVAAEDAEALVDALFSANFEHGVDMGDVHAVREFLSAHGEQLPDDTWQRHARGDGEQQVQADLVLAQQLGIQGVPFFLTGRKAISGAQEPDVFRKLLELAEEPIPELA